MRWLVASDKNQTVIVDVETREIVATASNEKAARHLVSCANDTASDGRRLEAIALVEEMRAKKAAQEAAMAVPAPAKPKKKGRK